MKRQVVQTFLNLCGISGLALIDDRTRPFFCGLDSSLNMNQQEALSHGIQQVIKTTPAGFDTFSFRFSEHLAHIYKLDKGVILLVLTSDQMELNEYLHAVDELKATLAEDLHDAVATFRLLAGCVTMKNGEVLSDQIAPVPAEGPVTASATPTISPTTVPTVGVVCGDVLAAINHLSDFATQYLGKIIVANTWKLSRPPQPWLENFEVQRSGHFKLAIAGSTLETQALTEAEQQWIKDWVQSFIERCGKTIRDFPKIVVTKGLDPQQRQLLLKQDIPL